VSRLRDRAMFLRFVYYERQILSSPRDQSLAPATPPSDVPIPVKKGVRAAAQGLLCVVYTMEETCGQQDLQGASVK